MRVGLIDLLRSPDAPAGASHAAPLAGDGTEPIRAILLRGAGRGFSGGLSLDAEPGAPTLGQVTAAIEAATVPVVVALHGSVMGPGAEIALAAHARVAHVEARLALPDIGIGLLPEGGTTQRLPRLVGAAEALRMLLTGVPVGAVEGLAMGMIDQVIEGDPLPAALAMAARLADAPPPPVSQRRDGLRDAAGHLAAVARARADQPQGAALPAPAAVIACVEAALLMPFEAGLALEETLRAELAAGPEAEGLRAAALAERRAARLPAPVAAAQPRAVAHLGLAGAAPAQVSLALAALGRGMKVTLTDADRGRLAAALEAVARRQEAEVQAGRLSAAARDADWARLGSGTDERLLSAAGVIVAAPARTAEDLAALARLAPSAVLVVLGGAEGRMGLAPCPSGRAGELSLPDGAQPAAVAQAVALLRRLGLPPVLVGRAPVVGGRVQAAGQAALRRLLVLGVPRRAVMAAMAAFGRPVDDLPETAPAALRAMAPAEIVNRWLGAMANEGLRLLAAGIARRPSDIDHLLVAGHGFPRWQGGPMHLADRRGVLVLRADLRTWAADDPLWSPAPILDRMVADSRRIAALNAR